MKTKTHPKARGRKPSPRAANPPNPGNELPDWSDGRDTVKRVAEIVEAGTHLADAHQDCARIRTSVYLVDDDGSQIGDWILNVEDFATPGECIDLCRMLAETVEAFRKSQVHARAAAYGIVERDDLLPEVHHKPRRPETTAA